MDFLNDLSLASILAFLTWGVGVGAGAIAAAAYDRTVGRLAWFSDAKVRNWFLPGLAAAVVAVLGAALVPAEALAGSAFAPLVDAAIPVIAGAAGWQGAARAMSAKP